MLKINLLPRHIRDRRRVPLYAAVCGVIFVSLALVFGFFVIALGTQVSKLNREVEDLATQAKAVQDSEARVAALGQEASVAKGRVDFVQAVQRTGPDWADYIEKLSRWVPANAYLDSWTIDGGNLEWKGRLQLENPSKGLTSDEYMRFLINIQRCPLLSSPTLTLQGLEEGFSLTPGKSRAGAEQSEFVPFSVKAALVNPPSLPAYGPAVQAAAAATAAATKPALVEGKGAGKPSAEALGEEEGMKGEGKPGALEEEEELKGVKGKR